MAGSTRLAEVPDRDAGIASGMTGGERYAALRPPFVTTGIAVPIMQSRVTMAARSASPQPRVPLGRMGSTRWRRSAVGVAHAHLRASRQLDAELGQHAARVDHHARAVGEALVPGRRDAEQQLGIAGAQRADDDVVDAGHVLDGAIVGQRADIDADLGRAERVSASRRFLKSASTQALATTLAPSAGERLSIRSTWAAISCAVSTPFSISSERTASSNSS